MDWSWDLPTVGDVRKIAAMKWDAFNFETTKSYAAETSAWTSTQITARLHCCWLGIDRRKIKKTLKR